MARLAAVLLGGIILLGGDPSLADMFRRYAQIKTDVFDMQQTVCPKE